MKLFWTFSTFVSEKKGSNHKPVANPWFTRGNPWNMFRNPGYRTQNPGSCENPGFFETRGEPVANPWFTRAYPWFKSRVRPPKSYDVFVSFSGIFGIKNATLLRHGFAIIGLTAVRMVVASL